MSNPYETAPETVVHPSDMFVPMDLWGKDHWSTLAYIETVIVDLGGCFQIGLDAHMRSNRAHLRVMSEQCPRPKRVASTGKQATAMDRVKHRTRLNDGSEVDNHDDWCCLQDMAEAGLFTVNRHYPKDEVLACLLRGYQTAVTALFTKEPEAGPNGPITIGADQCQPGVLLRFTPLGFRVAGWVRRQKMTGFSFGQIRARIEDFMPTPA